MGITSLGAYSPLGYELTFLTKWHCQLLRAYYHNHIRQNNNRKSICKRAISLGLWYECVEKYHNIFTLLYMLEICNSFEKIYIIKIGIYFSRCRIIPACYIWYFYVIQRIAVGMWWIVFIYTYMDKHFPILFYCRFLTKYWL